MDRFLSLEYDPASKVPPIDKLLASVGEMSQNAAFFQIANQLHFSERLNSVYSLVSLRKLVEMSPILKENASGDELKPVNSYKWLFLIHSLAARSLTTDAELDEAKIEYVLKAYFDFLKRADMKAPNVMHLMTGVCCAMARLLDVAKKVPDFLVSDEAYDVYLRVLCAEDVPNLAVDIEGFCVKESALFLFGCPVNIGSLVTQAHWLNDTKSMVRASVLRVLRRTVLAKAPTRVEDLKAAVQPMCVKGFITDLAKDVLLLLFGGDIEKTYQYTDTIQYQNCSKVISGMAKKTNGFKNALLYQECIVLSENLMEIKNVATERPAHWKAFLTGSSFASDLTALMFSDYDVEFVIAAVVLMRLAEAKLENAAWALKMMITARSNNLRCELKNLLLLYPDTVARDVLTVFPLVCSYGSRSELFFEFLAELLTKVSDELGGELIKAVVQALKEEYQEIKQLPNSHIYTQLAQYIDVTASYLDEQPCTVCNNPERQLSAMVVNECREFIKWTYDSFCVKLKESVTVQSFTVSLADRKTVYKSPRTVKVYLSSVDIANANDLLSDTPKWRLVAEMNFQKDALTSTYTLPLQTYATCIKVQVSDLWEEANSSVLRCPNCRAEIPDPRSGICPRCHDNCYQCSSCRYINMAHLDGVFCVECGNCTLGKLSCSLMAIPAFSHTQIKTNDDCDKALKKCDETLASAHHRYEKLTKLRTQIEDALSPACTLGLNDRTELLNKLYNNDCKSLFMNLTTNVQHVYAMRTAIAKFKKRVPKNSSITEEDNMCYNCRATFLRNCLKFFVAIVKRPEVDALDIPSLLFSFAKETTGLARPAVDSLLEFCSLKWELTLKIVDIFEQSLPNVPPQIIRLLCSLEEVNDDQRLKRLLVFINALESACNCETQSSAFTPTVLQPLLSSVCSSPLIIRKADAWELTRIVGAWRKKETDHKSAWDLILHKPFASALFFNSSSQTVRQTLADLYKAALSQGHFADVADLVVKHVMEAQRFGPCDQEAYHLLRDLFEQRPSFALHTLYTGLFDHIISIFEKEVDIVLGSEQNIVLNLAIGLEVNELMNIIRLYLLKAPILRYVVKRKTEHIKTLIRSYFKLRSLLIQRSKYLDDALSTLRDIVMMVADSEYHFGSQSDQKDDKDSEEEYNVPNPEGPKLMLTSAIDAISFCPDVVIKEVSAIIFAEPKQEDIPIMILKARSQLDFIPGRLPDSPMMSSRIGTLFKDIKSRFCMELGMEALMADEHSLELLVAGNLIGLNMNIYEIYHRVWVPVHGTTAMEVICRLQGLDGEATEPMINESEGTKADDIDPEVKYGYTTVLCGQGFQEMLSAFSSPDLSMKGLAKLVALLGTMAKVKKNRESLIELKAINVLFDAMKRFVDRSASAELLASVIAIVQLLIVHAHGAIDDIECKVKFVFDSLKTKLLMDNPNVAAALMALVPAMAHSQDKLLKRIIKFFISGLRQESSTEEGANFFENIQSIFMLDMFSEMILALPEGHALRSKIDEECITADAVKFIDNYFPLEKGKTSPEWEHTLEAPCLPMILKVLTGMAIGHEPSQKLFLEDPTFLKIMVELETVTSKASIGEFAHNFLVNASKEPSICASKIEEIMKDRAEAARQRAEAERQKALSEHNTGLNPALQALFDQLDDCAWSCCICKDGYDFNEKELLGVYSYADMRDGFANTATLFVCIHPSCHAREVKGDDEWEVAKIRNEERECNSIFPLPSATLPPNLYKQALTRFLEPYKRSIDYAGKIKEEGESISWGDMADYDGVDYRRYDVGMNSGVGVWYDRFNLDLCYQCGFVDVYSDYDGIKTSNFMIRLGIAF